MKTQININGHPFYFSASETEGTKIFGLDGVDLVKLNWVATNKEVEAALLGWSTGFWKGNDHYSISLQACALKSD